MASDFDQGIDVARVADIVRDAGGELWGRTRLQKLAFFLEVVGLGDGYSFQYRRFGPYSEELAMAARNAHLLGLLIEEERKTNWGGSFSVYLTRGQSSESVPPARVELAGLAAKADPVELELAATALFLHLQGETDAWRETSRRKTEKASDGRLLKAKALYRAFREVRTPKQLPEIIETTA